MANVDNITTLINSNSILNRSFDRFNSAINVIVNDLHNDIFDLHLSQKLNQVFYLSGGTKNNDTFTLVSGHSFSVGDFIEIWQNHNGHWLQNEIVVVNSDDITLDIPLPFDIDIDSGAILNRVNVDMAINGSVTEVPFTFHPLIDFNFDVIRIIGHIVHSAAGDDSKFGSIGALSNGIYFNIICPNSHNINLFNVSNNGEFKERTYNLQYSDKAGGGLFSTSFRRTFGGEEKNGAIIRVGGGNGDYFQVVVRDNLSTLTNMHITIQGHITDKISYDGKRIS